MKDEFDRYEGDEEEPNVLAVHWWHAEGRGFELAFLPLRADGAGVASETHVVAYAWSMAPSSVVAPLFIYAVVLSGEPLLDAGVALDVELLFPIARPLDRQIIAAI